MTRKTKTERAHLGHALELHQKIDRDFADVQVPDSWHDIWRARDDEAVDRQAVQLEVDVDVLRFFKSLGPGHTQRMNRVLRAFMHDRLAGLIAGPEDRSLPEDVDAVLALEAELQRYERKG